MAEVLIEEIKINDVLKSELIASVVNIVYNNVSSDGVSTLDINFTLDSSLNLAYPIKLFDVISIIISFNDIRIEIKDYYVDRNIIKVKNDIQFVGTQSYNYGLGVGRQGDGDADNNEDDGNFNIFGGFRGIFDSIRRNLPGFNPNTTEVNIGGNFGRPTGAIALDALVATLCFPFDLNQTRPIETFPAGFSNSSQIPVGIVGKTYLETINKLAVSYGYSFTLKSSDDKNFNGLCYFVKQETIESEDPILSINREGLAKELSYQTDLSKTYRNFELIFKDRPGSRNNIEKRIIRAIDYRIPEGNKNLFRDEKYQETREAALARLRGMIYEFNQKTDVVKFSIPGNLLIESNKVVELVEFNPTINGKYVVMNVIHNISNSGFISDMTCYKIKPLSIELDIQIDPSIKKYDGKVYYNIDTFDGWI